MLEWLVIPIALGLLISFGVLASRNEYRLMWRYRRAMVILRRYARRVQVSTHAKEETWVTRDGMIVIETERLGAPLVAYYYLPGKADLEWWQTAHVHYEIQELNRSDDQTFIKLRARNGDSIYRTLPADTFRELKRAFRASGLAPAMSA